MTPDSPTDFGQCSSIIKEIVERFETSTFESIIEDYRVTGLCLGWAVRMVETAQAIVILHQNEMSQESSPLVRSMIQHAVATKWLVDKKAAAIDAVRHGHRRHQKLLRECIEKGRWRFEWLDELGENHEQRNTDAKENGLENREIPDEWYKLENFEQLVKHYDIGEWYCPFRLESATTHPSYLSAAVYFQKNENGFFNFEIPAPEPGVSLRVTAAMLAMGIQNLGTVAQLSEPLRRALKEANEQLEPNSSNE